MVLSIILIYKADYFETLIWQSLAVVDINLITLPILQSSSTFFESRDKKYILN